MDSAVFLFSPFPSKSAQIMCTFESRRQLHHVRRTYHRGLRCKHHHSAILLEIRVIQGFFQGFSRCEKPQRCFFNPLRIFHSEKDLKKNLWGFSQREKLIEGVCYMCW
jgi:hypothetical protein